MVEVHQARFPENRVTRFPQNRTSGRRRTFTAFVVLFTLSSLLLNCDAAEKPNVLFIAVDDMRDWVGYLDAYPGTVYTPNIDRLATMGTGFTNAHTAAPVCCPSRAAVMSGRMPSSTGIYHNQQWWKPAHPDLVTLPVHFRDNGYSVFGAGKLFHHTGGNNPPGQWDIYHRLVFNDDAWARWNLRKNLYPYTKQEALPAAFPYSGIALRSKEDDWGVLPIREFDMDDFRTARFGMDVLEQKHDKPFFLACGIFRPHMPWYTPRKYTSMYPLDDVVLPRIPEDDLDDVPEAGRKLALAKSEDLKKVRDAGKWEEAVRQYLASISYADANVGRLLKALEESAYADNTIVIFWSDHGWHLGEKGHWHKVTLWEEATRVPFIIRAPGHGSAGQRCDHPVSLVDIFPTLVELCGLSSVKGLDGKSLQPLLDDPYSDWNRPVVTEANGGHCAVRDNRYRYIRYGDGSEELYDHSDDPKEHTNRADDQSLAEVKSRIARYATNVWADPVPVKNDYEFDPQAYVWLNKQTNRRVEGGTCELAQ